MKVVDSTGWIGYIGCEYDIQLDPGEALEFLTVFLEKGCKEAESKLLDSVYNFFAEEPIYQKILLGGAFLDLEIYERTINLWIRQQTRQSTHIFHVLDYLGNRHWLSSPRC